MSDAGQDAFEPQVVVDQSGNEHHIWTRFDGANTVSSTGCATTQELRPGQTLSAAGQGASQPDIDVDPNGDAVAVWTRSDGSHLRVEAAARPAGGSFGAVQAVSAAGQNTDKPQVALDDSGKAVAVWIRYDTGPAASDASSRRCDRRAAASGRPRRSPRGAR